MPYRAVEPRQRIVATVAAGCLQLALVAALVSGLRVSLSPLRSSAQKLIEIVVPVAPDHPGIARRAKATHTPSGGSRNSAETPQVKPPALPPSTPIRIAKPASGAVQSDGGGNGTASGTGAGTASGGGGGGGGGGSDLELLSGDITPRDYPRDLGQKGIGGRVSVRFTVEPNGRADHCRVVRSSGIGELDSLTCALIVARFRFRPSTDRFGRPIADDVDWDQDWDPYR